MKGMQDTFMSGFGMSSAGFYPGSTSNYHTSHEGEQDKLDRES